MHTLIKKIFCEYILVLQEIGMPVALVIFQNLDRGGDAFLLEVS